MKILVLNSFGRNGLAAINDMPAEYTVYGGGDFRKGYHKFLCNVFKSPRLSGVYNIASPSRDPEQFREDVIRAVNDAGIDVVLPTGTAQSDYLSKFKDEITSRCSARIAVEDFDKQSRATDKWLTYLLCRDVGVPVPKTVLIDHIENLPGLLDQGGISFPCVFKPRIATASEGVEFFDSASEVAEFVRKHQSSELSYEDESCIVQERIEGDLHDITSLAWGGDVYAMLSQKRVMTWYDFGGGGIINITTDEPTIKEYAKNVLEELSWHGILEFDFIRNSQGQYFLIECNPKIWGTTQLTIDAGLSMPRKWVELLVSGETQPLENYEVGLVYKWIFPYCVASWLNKPHNIGAVLKRIYKTFRHYEGTRTLTNLKLQYFSHLIGNVVIRLP